MRLGSFGLVVAVLACGPAPGDDDGATSSDADTSAVDGSASGSASGSSSGEISCEIFEPDEGIGPLVTIDVRNESGVPVFFEAPGCMGTPLLFVTSQADGSDVPHVLRACDTCAGYIANDCAEGCNDCGEPTGARLEPGLATETYWPGHVLRELELIASCTPSEGCPTTCMHPEKVISGAYEIGMTIYRTCNGACECDSPTPSGDCNLQGALELADSFTISTVIDYPTQTTVELVIAD